VHLLQLYGESYNHTAALYFLSVRFVHQVSMDEN